MRKFELTSLAGTLMLVTTLMACADAADGAFSEAGRESYSTGEEDTGELEGDTGLKVDSALPETGDDVATGPEGDGDVLKAAIAATPCDQFCPSSRIQILNGGCGCVSSNRQRAYACDQSEDGRGVTTFYTIATPSGQAGGNVGDANGAQSGCGGEGPDVAGNINSFHLCVGGTCGPQIGPF